MNDCIATVIRAESVGKLEAAFGSFRKCGLPMVAWLIGDEFKTYTCDGIEYRSLSPFPRWLHPLREIYYSRLRVFDGLPFSRVLMVDGCDTFCLRKLPPLHSLLPYNKWLAAVPEHNGGRKILGAGYTASFLNGGVVLWDVLGSRLLRDEVYLRGLSHFRTVADDQLNLNEVAWTCYPDRIEVLPAGYNFRPYIGRTVRGMPTVRHLDGVCIYHGAACLETARNMSDSARHSATLPMLPVDSLALGPMGVLWRRIKNRLLFG